jgi:hypothetical protein
MGLHASFDFPSTLLDTVGMMMMMMMMMISLHLL